LTISIGNKIDFFSLYVALERSVNCSTVLTSCHFFVNWSNPVEPGLTRFEQLKNFVLSSWFPAKSVDELIVEQSNFEQLVPTRLKCPSMKMSANVNFFKEGFKNRLIFRWNWIFGKIISKSFGRPFESFFGSGWAVWQASRDAVVFLGGLGLVSLG
jgi:hypothetical protein